MKVWVTAEGKPLKTEEDERTLGWEVKAEITDLSYSFGTVGRMTRVHSTNLPTTTWKKPWLEWTSCGTSDWWEEFLADLLGSLLLFLWAPHPTLGLAFFQQPASDSLFFFLEKFPQGLSGAHLPARIPERSKCCDIFTPSRQPLANDCW